MTTNTTPNANTNKAQEKIEAAAVHGLSVELVPGKGWREAARTGRRSMSFRLQGTVFTGAGRAFVSASVPAIGADGSLLDLAEGFTASLLAKDDPKLDTARLSYGADGKPAVGETGEIAYAEPVLLQDDGKEFDLFYGTMFLVVPNRGKRVTLKGLRLTDTGRKVKDGTAEIPVMACDFDGLEVTDAVVAAGPALRGSVRIGSTAGTQRTQAARHAQTDAAAGQELQA